MKRRLSKPCSAIMFTIVIMLCCRQGFAQSETSAPKDSVTTWKWQFLLEPYILFGNMKGTIGIGNLPDAEVDEDASEIFKNLEFGAMLYFEVYSPKWAFSSDLIYMRLGSDLEPKTVVTSGELELKQLGWEVAALRKIFPILEAGIGLQLNSVKAELDINYNTAGGPQVRNGELSETWLDPMIIARLKLPLFKKLLVTVRPSIGGFGVGSDLAWQLQANASYRFSTLFQLSLGYRVISMDYETGSDSDRFHYDLDTFGPVLRFGFNF